MRGTWKCWTVASIILVTGCGHNSQPAAKSESKPSPTLSISNSTPPAPTRKLNLNMPFTEAVSEESPGNQQLPPDRTMAGASTAKIRLEVQRLWDTVKFVENGKPVIFQAVYDTELGKFTVQLDPDVAPNHVRNFICLVKAGYYNGLVFEHIIQAENDDENKSIVEIVEGGCPLGTGEPGVGHLGYWVKPEFSDNVTHEPGTLGAFHDDSPDSAACRFYITLTKAPAMDGYFTAFGRVVTGLDVVRTIAKQPKIENSIQPVKPVVIRSISIEELR